ncbi:kinase-like protein [Rhizophagus irregularis]|uniref:Kinase-like protein n=1 Tax=Rhizophagus irregularis TaxID=588596 RepID=A0A2N0PIK6_9GLOM|nr:kinase-like protein [Rhizophagus irregularis]
MELVKLNDENSFDPTPKLKSSPVPIFFISFNWEDNYCIHCGEGYTKTIVGDQKYCKKCLSYYLTNITNNNIYLDIHLFIKDLECNSHEISRTKIPQNIQECCQNCLIVLYFKQIVSTKYLFWLNRVPYNLYEYVNNVIESEKYCKLCGKLLYRGTDYSIMNIFKLCLTCYLISSGCIESTLTKKFISIIYLPFWDNTSRCCNKILVFTSNCQKYCENCLTFFIGCRYCLTTNIIFGITNQSQCKKCKRVSTIILNNGKMIDINSGHSVLDDFLINIRHDQLNIAKFANDLKNINIIYQATWIYDLKNNNNSIVVLKRFKNLQYAKKYFLKELESNHRCYKLDSNINETFGFTKDPKLDDYILVMQYASEGVLHKYLHKKFTKIGWERKISILYDISSGLMNVHNSNFIHRDFHSGNILVNSDVLSCRNKVGDLGLSRSANDISLDDEIYGVIPYIAPEIFKGSAFSKESDIYSLGMIMWELTTGCKPFANVEHDHNLIFNIIDGVRPEITEDTPQSEFKREKLIDLKKLGPNFSLKSHPKAIYTSRSLNSYISKCSSIFTKCSSINFSSNDYTSKELELDIDIESGLNSLGIKRNIEELNINSCENNGKRIKN